jgi:two-component system cell cycle sensor histidine kinase/response regulator CckA
MKHIADFSIRGKLTFIVMTTTCAALCLAMVAMGFFDAVAGRAQLRRDAVTNARIIANNSTAALSFGDEKAAAETLDALAVDTRLGAAVLYDAEGKQIALYRRPNWEISPPPTLRENHVHFTHEQIEVAQPVLLNGQRLGTVLLQVDLRDLRKRQWLSVVIALVVLLVAAGLSYLLTRRWQRFIATPIQNLATASNAVAMEKNYAVRVAKQANDELGQLVDGFNNMLSQIETRDKALREAHGELEHRVAERTQDLFQANQRLLQEVDNHKRAREESDALRVRLQLAYENLQQEAAEREAMQQKLQRSEERFSRAFRSSPVALAILKRGDRKFVDVNHRFAELAGVTAEALIGTPLFGVSLWSVPETRARIEQLFADGQALRNWACRIAGEGDKTRQALLSAESFQLGDEPCVLLMTEDISERVSLEGQLRQAQKMEAIGQLAAGVAHDFNNLLTVIQGYSQLLLAMAPAGNPGQEPLEKILSATQRAAGLTSQLLTFSRKQVAQPKAVDLNKVVGNVTGMLRPLLGENIRFNLRPAPQLPAIMADAAMLEQVLVNLAVNARDAMPKGGDLIVSTFTTEIDASYVKCRAQARAGKFVCLQVSDSGMGMDSVTLERIFEPFFTTKGVGKGTGLGLATVYGIVKQHHGWLEVASQIGVGTTFKVFLPAVKSAVNQTEFIQNPDAVQGGDETILVVEDEPALRELVTKVLRNYGYQVLEAAHGKEAIRVWQGLANKPALLLTDMMMPEGMTGWELAEQIRVESPELKVLFTSGYSPEIFGGDVQLDERANFLPKPYHPRILARTVRSCLDNKRPERPQPILP